MLEGHDSRSITFAAGMGALADAGLGPRDIDGVVGQSGSDLIYQARNGPVWRSYSGMGIPAVLEVAERHRHRARVDRAHQRGIRGRVHRPVVDRAVDASVERVRGAVRHVHRGRVRAHRAPAHAPLRHAARGARDRRRHHPQQRAREPGGLLLRARAVHRAGHPRQPHGGRPVPPPRLLDDRRGRVRARARPRRHRPRPRPGPDLGARRQHRPLRPVVPAPTGVGPGRQRARRSRRRHRRAPRDRRPRGRCRGSGPTTSTCASCTTRSRSRSSASSRRSGSAPRARAATT